MKSRHKRIINLWQRNPRCHYCGRLTVLIFRPSPQKGMQYPPLQSHDWEATIEHLNSRLSGRRCQTYDGIETTVLSCWRCNNDANKYEQDRLPLEELQRRSGNCPGKQVEKMAMLVNHGWEPWPDGTVTFWQDPYTKRIQSLYDAIHKQTRRNKFDRTAGYFGEPLSEVQEER